jgi:hypothetical protein
MKDLEKLEQQAKALESINLNELNEEQLTKLAEQLSSMFEESESFINNLTEELKIEENDENE